MYVYFEDNQIIKTGVSIEGIKDYANERHWTPEQIETLEFVGTHIIADAEPNIALKSLLRKTRADSKADGYNRGPFTDTDTDAEQELDRWKDRSGDYVKFVDEEAMIEAQDAETRFPILYIGKLMDAYLIRIYQDEIIIAKIQPLWDSPPKHVQISLVRFAE